MGDFFVVRTMSGGQSGSVASAMMNEIGLLQYPSAAAGQGACVVAMPVPALFLLAPSGLTRRSVPLRRRMDAWTKSGQGD
jgi:hypothetical protein